MSAVELHNVDDAVEQIASGIATASRPAPTWGVLGEPTSGKSAVLDGLHQRLAAEGTLRPVLVSPPPRAYDAGHAALIDLAEGLDLNERALDVIRDPRTSWDRKFKRVRAALGREGRVVVLVDEPATWSPRETYFRTFVDDVWGLVFQGFDVVTVSAGNTPFPVRGFRPVYLDPASNPENVLTAIDSPTLVDSKQSVEARFGAHLAEISPLQIRLLVAIGALRNGMLDQIDPTSIDHRAELVRLLAELVESESPSLRDVWLHLATVREPFEDDLLGLVGSRDLTPRETAIATQCLLFRRRERLVLHESLRTITTLIVHDETEVHSLLARYYRHRFDDPESGVSTRLRDSVEAFHHASSAGIVELDTYRPFFVDQLNILGYHLSVEREDRQRAAEVFGLALEWDTHNAYAAHYRAFNLDLLAGTPGAKVDPNEVERLYRQAAEEWPHHSWFRSRLITFLIAEARIEEAWSEWLSANEAFGPDPSESVYYGLHLHVARTFLYRGELDYADIVLRGLPPELLRDERFVAIRERLMALREARDYGSYVPAPFMIPGWWRHPTHLSERELIRWLAARVTSVSSDGIELDVADITPGDRPVYGGLELPYETFASWWGGPGELATLEVGEFIEIGFYGDNDAARAVAIRHPRVRWPDAARPNEDPDRYLRAAA